MTSEKHARSGKATCLPQPAVASIPAQLSSAARLCGRCRQHGRSHGEERRADRASSGLRVNLDHLREDEVRLKSENIKKVKRETKGPQEGD